MKTDLFHGTRPWESPEVQGLGRLPMRAPLLPWAKAEDARRAARLGPAGRNQPANPLVLTLDGEWDFALAANPEATPEGFHQPAFATRGWSKLRVPGTWTLQGHDKPHYTNVMMPFGNVPPSAPASHNPTGLYRVSFNLPAGWEGRRVVLHLGGAESFLEAWCNGEWLGFSKDTRLPSEFDLTGSLKRGENLLAFRVIRYSDSSFIEDQDQWWYGGIYRSVYLYSTESVYLADLEARALPSPDFSSGRVEVAVKLGFTFDPAAEAVPAGTAPVDYPPHSQAGAGAGPAAAAPAWRVRVALYGARTRAASGDVAAGGMDASPESPIATAECAVGALYRASRWEARLALDLREPEAWTDETPALYCLVTTLVSPEGREIEHGALRLGFRTVEVRDRKLLLNGERVMIRGVNRHEHDERWGKTLDLASMLRDIELLKRNNFNAVRLSHYPNDERWYELCDEFGLYLFDEANVESHAYYDHLCRDQRWAAAFLERGSRMVLRDRNHPSVIVWSLGNESGYGENHDAMAAWIRRADPTRPLHYEGCMRPEWGQGRHDLESCKRGAASSDIVSTMYPTLDLVEGWARTTKDTRPFIMCEYSHAMGNSNGSLSDYWELIERLEGLQGGFIWDWVDQGIEAFATEGGKYWKYGGDFGDKPSDLDFICNGLVFPDRTEKPVLAEAGWLFRPVSASSDHPLSGRVKLRNRRHFTALGDLEMRWTVQVDGKPVLSGSLPLPPVAPGAETEVAIDYNWDETTRAAAASGEAFLRLDFVLAKPSAWAPAGFRLGWEQLRLDEGLPPRARASTARAASPARLSRQDGGWRAEAGGLAFGVSAAGFIDTLAAGGKPLLASPVVMNLWRAPTENDGLKLFMDKRGMEDFSFYYENKAMYAWLDAGLDSLSFSAPAFEADPDSGRLRVVHEARTRTGARAGRFVQDLSFEEHGIKADFLLDLDRDLPELPRVGLAFALQPGFELARWYGRGPHECYVDRKASAALGLWETGVDGLQVPYVLPQENGNRTETRWLELGSSGLSLRLEGDRPFDFTASHHGQEQLWKAAHTHELVRRPETFVTIDIAQRGLGTATCGPDTVERYRLRPGAYGIGLFIAPAAK